MSKKAQALKRSYEIENSAVTVSLRDNPDVAIEYSPSLPDGMTSLHIGAVLQHGADVIAAFVNKQITEIGKSAVEAFELAKEVVKQLEDGTLPTRKGASGEIIVTAEDKYNCLRQHFPTHRGLSPEATAKFLATLEAAWEQTTTVTKTKKSDGTTYTQLKRSGFNSLVNKSAAAQEVLAKYLETQQADDPLANMG